jgi:hypothetical protein
MVALNDIPDSLKASTDDSWTPGRGLLKGSIWTLSVAVALGAGFFVLTYYIPALARSWVLNIAWGFFASWALFAVMHRTAGMVSSLCTLVVISCSVVAFVGKYLGFLGHLSASEEAAGSMWSLLSVPDFFLANLFNWVGVVIAAVLCHSGESVLLDVADRLMSNPFTGRRV